MPSAAPPDSTRGSLAERPLPQLLIELHRERFHGWLHLHQGRAEKRIGFQRGYPVSVASNLMSETLSHRLTETGRIKDAERDRVRERVRARRSREEAVLLELQLLTPREVFDALRELQRHCMLESCAWADGSYRLDDTSPAPQDADAFRSDPIALAAAGVATRWSRERVWSSLSPALAGFARLRPEGEALLTRAGELAAEVAACLDGRRPLGVLLQELTAPEAAAWIWVLHAAAGLHLSASAQGSAAADPETVGPEIELVVQDSAAADTQAPAATEEPGRGPSPEAQALRAEIEDRRDRLQDLDHYEQLGVDRKATPAQVKRAYVQLAKRFHPDTLARLGLESLRADASALFARIAAAHSALSDPVQRRAYDESLAGDPIDVGRLAQAETLFRKGEVLVRAGRFGDALEYLEPAVALWPDEAAYCSELGWALFKQRRPDLAAARRRLERAAELAPEDAGVLERLAQVRSAG